MRRAGNGRRWLPGLAGMIPALIALAGIAGAADVEVEAGLEPEDATLDEAVIFWIEVRSRAGGNVRFNPDFRLENLERLGRPSSSSSFRFVNGASTRSSRLTWRLRPLELGSARVRDIRVRLGGKTFDLPNREIRIVAEAPPGRRASPRGQRDPFGRSTHPLDPFRRFDDLQNRRPPGRRPKVFLRSEIHPRRPYAGQQTTYTLYIYTQADVSSVHPTLIPDFQGFWAHPVPQPETLQPEVIQVEGEGFSRVALLRRVLFPRRAGTLEIEPAELDLLIQVAERSFFGSRLSRPEKIGRKSNRLRVEVRPLPQAPAGFAGAVGDFSLEMELSSTELTVGEAATLTVTLAGDGHIQSLPAPALPGLPGLKVLPPEESVRDGFQGNRIRGERVWRYVLIPEHEGSWALEPLHLPFYDPAVDAFRVAASDSLALEARPGAAFAGGSVAGGTGTGELNPIRSAAVPLTTRPGWGSVLWWLFLAPVGLTLLLRLGGRDGRISDPGRARLFERLVATGDLHDHRRAGAQMERAWARFLTLRWGLPAELAAAKWAAALEDRLSRRGIDLLSSLAEDLHYLRHAPELSATDALRRELIHRSRHLARRLR